MTRHKPSHILLRKKARTAIYRAVFGTGGKVHNTPWSDPSRSRPQDWHAQDALATVTHYRVDANLDRIAAIEVASALQVTIDKVMA